MVTISLASHDGAPEQAASSEPAPKPLLDVVSCSGADTALVMSAARMIHAEGREVGSLEMWIEQLSRLDGHASYEPADVVIIVGQAERLIGQQWVRRAKQAAAHSVIAVAASDVTFDQMMSLVNQGARGLLVVPSPPERLAQHLKEIVGPVVERRDHRRAVIRHRRAAAALTPAENEVLEAMLTGMPNKQIAQRLSIGLRTVELRRSKIMKKMKAKSLAQLIKFICLSQLNGD